jgi:hypothetical protein
MTIRHWLFFGGFFTNLKTEEPDSTVADVDIKVAMTPHTLVMFAVCIVMQWSEAVCPMVVYIREHFVHFVIDTKPVDTCFYTWTVSGTFDLAKVAFFILRKCSVYRPCFRRNPVLYRPRPKAPPDWNS